MQDWAENLLALQENDLRIDKLQQQIDAVPEQKAAAEKELRDELELLKSAQTRLNDVKKAINHIEMEIEGAKDKQRDFEKKTTMIKDNEEYRVALHQIETCKEKISKLEDQELENMEALEEARKQLEDEKKTEKAAEKRVSEILADLDKREENCQAQVTKLSEKRTDLANGVPDKILRKYERMRASRKQSGGNPEVLCEVKDTTCTSCHMSVPPQIKTNARKGMLEQCPQCHALLYA